MAITQRYAPGKLFGTTTISTTRIEEPKQASAMLARRSRSRARTRDAFEALSAKASEDGTIRIEPQESESPLSDNAYRKAKFSFDDERRSFAARRFIFPIVVAALVAVAAVAGIASGFAESSRISDVYDLPYVEVIVEQGDTLESIAAEHPVDGLSSVELSRIVSDVNASAKTSPLMPGDVILVPSAER